MEFPYKLRRFRRTRNASSPSETYHFRNWRKIEKIKRSIKSKSHHYRIFLLVFLGLCFNVFPDILINSTAYSLFKFDLIGTFLLAFLAGPNVAVLGALATALISFFFLDTDNGSFSVLLNVIIAVTWGVLPRLGWPFFGSDILKKRNLFGYRYFISRVIFFAGCSSVLSMVIITLIREIILRISLSEKMASIDIINYSYVVNQIKISSPMMLIFGSFGGQQEDYFAYFAAPLLLLTFVGHLMQICISLTIIYLFFEWPYFRNQNERLFDRHESDNQWWNSSLLSSLSLIVLNLSIYSLNIEFVSKIFISMLVFVGVLLIWYKSPVSTRSIDPYRAHGYRKGLFINSDKDGNTRDHKYKISYFRDGIEDLLKMSAIFISILSAASFAIISHVSDMDLKAVVNAAGVRSSDISAIFAFNVLAVTGIRYGLVILLRIFEKA